MVREKLAELSPCERLLVARCEIALTDWVAFWETLSALRYRVTTEPIDGADRLILNWFLARYRDVRRVTSYIANSAIAGDLVGCDDRGLTRIVEDIRDLKRIRRRSTDDTKRLSDLVYELYQRLQQDAVAAYESGAMDWLCERNREQSRDKAKAKRDRRRQAQTQDPIPVALSSRWIERLMYQRSSAGERVAGI